MASEPEFKPEPQGAIDAKFASENNIMPSPNFYTYAHNLKLRKLAVSVIAKHWKTDIDAFVPYLAMHYFDRFVSKSESQYSAVDKVPLVAITCLTIAASMRGIFVDTLLKDMFVDFNREAIEEMKLPIHTKLDNITQPLTPFCFLNHYYPKFKIITGSGFRRRFINDIIVQSQGEDKFVGYRPSEIAFSSFLTAIHKAHPRISVRGIPVPEGMRSCDKELFHLCEKKGIEIERTGMETTSSSSATAAVRQGQSGELAEETESERLRREKGKAPAMPESISEEEAPKRLMNFNLLWPIDDPFLERKLRAVPPETGQPASELQPCPCKCSIF